MKKTREAQKKTLMAKSKIKLDLEQPAKPALVSAIIKQQWVSRDDLGGKCSKFQHTPEGKKVPVRAFNVPFINIDLTTCSRFNKRKF